MSLHKLQLEGDVARKAVRAMWPAATSTYTGATSAQVYDQASGKVLGDAEADEYSVELAWVKAASNLNQAGLKPDGAMTYHPALVANAILTASGFQSWRIFPEQLQLLLYFVHVHGLVRVGKSLMTEQPQAWRKGPVFESVFYQVKATWGDVGPVDGLLEVFVPSRGGQGTHLPMQSGVIWPLVYEVLDAYGDLALSDLAARAREWDGPWVRAVTADSVFLLDEDVLEFYTPLLTEATA